MIEMPDTKTTDHLGDPITSVRRVLPPLTEGFEFVISKSCKYKTLIVMDNWCKSNAPRWSYGNCELGYQTCRRFRISDENAAMLFKILFAEYIVAQRQPSK
jgi:hypothetical protein